MSDSPGLHLFPIQQQIINMRLDPQNTIMFHPIMWFYRFWEEHVFPFSPSEQEQQEKQEQEQEQVPPSIQPRTPLPQNLAQYLQWDTT